MERQTILERIGWQFIRIRGSEYYSNPEAAMERVITKLGNYGIVPEEQNTVAEVTRSTELWQRTKARAAAILASFSKQGTDEIDIETIVTALGTPELLKPLAPTIQKPKEKSNSVAMRTPEKPVDKPKSLVAAGDSNSS